ncbi:MAG: hypothetical protein IPP83_00405, partial [Flavobacteriales bacterium]|nr:hypothetical protein [Flavobacteriales bacterium]
AQMEMNMVAKATYAVKCVHAINEKLKVDGISEATYRMLYEKMAPTIEMRLLRERLAGGSEAVVGFAVDIVRNREQGQGEHGEPRYSPRSGRRIGRRGRKGA